MQSRKLCPLITLSVYEIIHFCRFEHTVCCDKGSIPTNTGSCKINHQNTNSHLFTYGILDLSVLDLTDESVPFKEINHTCFSEFQCYFHFSYLVIAILNLLDQQVGLSSWAHKVNDIPAEPYKVTEPWSVSTVVSVHVTAARGSQSVSQSLCLSTMESSSCLFWLTSVWPHSWTLASSREVSAGVVDVLLRCDAVHKIGCCCCCCEKSSLPPGIIFSVYICSDP